MTTREEWIALVEPQLLFDGKVSLLLDHP